MNNLVVVITGASSGIGEALAYQYARRYHNIVLAARSESQLKIVAKNCREYGASDVIVVPTDVTHEGDCQVLIERAIESFNRIDILILNAGIGSHFRFGMGVNIDVYHQLMNTNFFGYLHCTKYAWPHLQHVKGQILVISSVSGEIGLPDRTAYCASKFAVTGFFDALDMEQQSTYNPNLVSITVVCPPSVKTNMRDHSIGLKYDSTQPVASEGVDTRMALDKCVSLILNAADKRSKKAYFPMKSSLAVRLRPFMPSILNPLIRRSSKL